MFDWDDEELRSIIWDEPDESDNLKDLYPVQFGAEALSGDLFKKGTNRGSSDISTVEQKKFGRLRTYDVSEECASGFSSDSLHAPAKPSSSNVAITEHDSLCTDASQNLKKGSKIISLDEKVSGFEKTYEACEKSAENGEESDLVFHGLENIGSFDDLDGIFSNNDSIFRDMAAVNAEELWSSFKDVASPPLEFPPFSGNSSNVPLGVAPSSNYQSKIKHHNVLDQCRASSPGYEAPKGNRKKRFTKDGKSEKRDDSVLNDSDAHLTFSCNSLQHANGNPMPSGAVNLSSNQHRPPFQNRRVQSSHFSGSNLPAPFYGNIITHHPARSMLLSSDYEPLPSDANCSKNPENASCNRPPMTPKEKIEKLRKRQQMRAIVAIQKQQQQFGNQVSPVERGKVQGNSSNISMAFNNCSMEESVLYQLQNAVHKLEMGVRLTVRDSLFRLAKSATQRQCPDDTSSTCANNVDEPHHRKDVVNSKRFNRLPAETETNPIDRTVAHLLFHRRPELMGRQAETSVSPLLKTAADDSFQGTTDRTPMMPSNSMKYPSTIAHSNQSGSSTPSIRYHSC